VADETPISQVDPPLGMYVAKLDDKGRLKLPADFQQYFSDLKEDKFFITSLDRRIGRIYTTSAWRSNEKFLAGSEGDPRKRRGVAFNAADLGGQSGIDGQGRLLVPAELRKELDLEGQQVRLFVYKGHVEMLNEKVYQTGKMEGEQVTTDDVGDLENVGLV
jgi:MraZ protein